MNGNTRKAMGAVVAVIVVVIVVVAAAAGSYAYLNNNEKNSRQSSLSSSSNTSVASTSASSTKNTTIRTTTNSISSLSTTKSSLSSQYNVWEEEYTSTITAQTPGGGSYTADSNGYLIFQVQSNNSITGSGRGSGNVNETGTCTGSAQTSVTFSAIGEYISFVGNVTVAFMNTNPLYLQWTVSCEGAPATTEQAPNPFPFPGGFAVKLANDQVFRGTYNGNGETINYTWTLYACPGGLCPLST